ncbi:acid protease [Sparassis latifolia]
MRPVSVPILLSLVALPAELVGAIRLDLHGSPARSFHSKRGSITGSSTVGDASNFQYTVDITLGGAQFTAQMDTGSSDLWVAGSVPNAQDTGKTVQVTYAGDTVDGPVQLANLEFLGYSVPNQAYINQPTSGSFPRGTGRIGLGPTSGSQVLSGVGNSSGDPALERIFQQNTSTSNYLSFVLGRVGNPGEDVTGQLTIGETLPEYSNVTSQPKLDVSILSSDNSPNQHWQTLLDANGIIGPTGRSVNVETAVSGTSNKNQLTVVFDTGYSLPQVPAAVAEAFYSSVPNSKLVNEPQYGTIWQMPCDYEVNVTFKFGGLGYPVNPVDTVMDLNATDSSGNKICYGAFQPISSSAQSSTYDMIFGTAFLRNVYVLVNFGDYVDGDTSNRAAPYLQLISTSNDTAQIHQDFVSLRGAAAWTPTYNGTQSSSSNSNTSSVTSWVKSHLGLVIGLSAGVGLILLGIILACCTRGRRRRGSAPMGFMSGGQRYQPLHDPAPPQAYDLHLMNQGGAHGYGNPWDSHY